MMYKKNSFLRIPKMWMSSIFFVGLLSIVIVKKLSYTKLNIVCGKAISTVKLSCFRHYYFLPPKCNIFLPLPSHFRYKYHSSAVLRRHSLSLITITLEQVISAACSLFYPRILYHSLVLGRSLILQVTVRLFFATCMLIRYRPPVIVTN